jgi:bifunctional non-homologous end joining protein LigD
MLVDLLGENEIDLPILYSEHLTGDGKEMFEHAAKLNWEGIVSKRADAPYRSDRNENWVKVKTVQQGKFPVIGFIKDPTGVAALYLGKREGKDLGLHGQGRDGLVSDGLKPNPQAARYRGEPEIKTHQTGKEAQGDVGGA